MIFTSVIMTLQQIVRNKISLSQVLSMNSARLYAHQNFWRENTEWFPAESINTLIQNKVKIQGRSKKCRVFLLEQNLTEKLERI